MSPVHLVPCEASVRVTTTGPVVHLCPHVEETDEGQVVIAWTAAGSTIELHSLAAHLRSYADRQISHEAFVQLLADDLALPGIEDLHVAARFTTAGLGVEVSSAVPREPIHAAGA